MDQVKKEEEIGFTLIEKDKKSSRAVVFTSQSNTWLYAVNVAKRCNLQNSILSCLCKIPVITLLNPFDFRISPFSLFFPLFFFFFFSLQWFPSPNFPWLQSVSTEISHLPAISPPLNAVKMSTLPPKTQWQSKTTVAQSISLAFCYNAPNT